MGETSERNRIYAGKGSEGAACRAEYRANPSRSGRRTYPEAVHTACDVFVESRVVGIFLRFLLDLRTGWRDNPPFPDNPLEWTIKHWSHHGELAHIGVARDPGNYVYSVMFQLLLKRLGVAAADEEISVFFDRATSRAEALSAERARLIALCFAKLLARHSSLRVTASASAEAC